MERGVGVGLAGWGLGVVVCLGDCVLGGVVGGRGTGAGRGGVGAVVGGRRRRAGRVASDFGGWNEGVDEGAAGGADRCCFDSARTSRRG